MGCFNYRCAISGLPIRYRDEVRFMLVTQNPVPQDYHSDTDTYWKPRTIPIHAYYNDYGAIEDIEEGLGFDLMMEGLRKDVVARDVGENEYHDVPVQPDMAFEEMMRALWEERVQVNSNRMIHSISTTPTPMVSYCMIRDDVWKAMLRLSSLNTFSDNRLKVKHFRDEVVRLYQLPAIDPGEAFKAIDLDLWEEWKRPLASVGLFDQFTFGLVGHWRLLLAHKLPLDQVKPLLNTLAEFAHIYMMLKSFGHQWLPSPTYGQQHGHFGDHAKFLSAMAAVGAKVHKKEDE